MARAQRVLPHDHIAPFFTLVVPGILVRLSRPFRSVVLIVVSFPPLVTSSVPPLATFIFYSIAFHVDVEKGCSRFSLGWHLSPSTSNKPLSSTSGARSSERPLLAYTQHPAYTPLSVDQTLRTRLTPRSAKLVRDEAPDLPREAVLVPQLPPVPSPIPVTVMNPLRVVGSEKAFVGD